MTTDYSRERHTIYSLIESESKYQRYSNRDWEYWLTYFGYPALPGTWARLMGNSGRLTRCYVRTLAKVLDKTVSDLVQPHRFEQMNECYNRHHWHHPDTGELLASTAL